MSAVSLDELSDILECAICLETVSNPKMLTCNHSYCKRCLDELLQFNTDGSAYIKCPKACTGTTSIAHDQTTNDLGIDYMLKGVIDIAMKDKLHETGTHTLRCESDLGCVRNVTEYCVVHDSFICKGCSVKHEKCREVNPFITVSSGVNGQQVNVVCKKHATDAIHICCSTEFICLYCVQRSHKGHSYETLESEAVELRVILSKEIKRMTTFIQNVNVNLTETEAEISNAKFNLEKLLKMKKVKCIKNYVDFLTHEEQRIKEEFDLVATNHTNEFYIADPTEYYKGNLTKKGTKIVLQKDPILKTMKQCLSTQKNIREITVSLSDQTTKDVHPLGELEITFGKHVAIDKAKQTFTSKLNIVENLSTKLLKTIQDLCQETASVRYKSPDDLASVRISNVDREEETSTTYTNATKQAASHKMKPHGTTNYIPMFTPDMFHIDLFEDEPDEAEIKQCLQKLDEDGIYYIEDLIQRKKNDELYMLLRQKPGITVMASSTAPFYNRPVHMAAKYNNLEFLKELVRHDRSAINFKNNIGSNALHAAASYVSSHDSFNWLVQTYPHLIEDKNQNGHTPLHVAASRNVYKAVQVLLNDGANIWEEDNDGNTPLDLARKYDCLDIMELIERTIREQQATWEIFVVNQ